MAARDDSVIRGSFIASLVFLVLSLALNVYLWQTTSTQTATALEATQRYTQGQQEVRTLTDKQDLLKSLLGVGNATQAERDELARGVQDDPDMVAILDQFETDMTLMGQEADPQNQNYQGLPQFLLQAIRTKNDVLAAARVDLQQTQDNAKSEVENARKAQQIAEEANDKANRELQDARTAFNTARDQLNAQAANAKDQEVIRTKELNQKKNELLQIQSANRIAVASYQATINSQRDEINRLNNDQFETFQGEIRSVNANVVMINLGSADELRRGVTFGVVAGDALRFEDAKVKATIRVTKVLESHYAQASIVSRAIAGDPIVFGDKIYSPFWSPGRQVKIALVGDIDMDGDGRPDNDALESQITAAGATVARTRVNLVNSNGATVVGSVTGLDNSIRFMVEGEGEKLITGSADASQNRASEEAVIRQGALKAKAQEYGITIISVSKLQAYLKTLDDSLTTPLGSAARAVDNPPLPYRFRARGVDPVLPEIYLRQNENVQRTNEILP